jgi:hypothetical protein
VLDHNADINKRRVVRVQTTSVKEAAELLRQAEATVVGDPHQPVRGGSEWADRRR